MLAKILPGAGGARPIPTFVSSSVNRSSTTTNTVTAPTGIQDGDLLVAIGLTAAATTGITPPTGFNVIQFDNDGTNNAFFAAVKTAASESGNYTFTWSAGFNNTITILVYRNATQVNTIGTLARAASGATATASSITPTYSGVLLAAFMRESGATITTPPSGMTLRSSYSAAIVSAYVYDQTQTATSTGTKSATWSTSTNDAASILLQVTNEPDVAPVFVASANTQQTTAAAALTINKPSGTVEGDFMVSVVCAAGGSDTWTGDTGWTEVCDQGASPTLRVAYKTAGASEPTSYTFTSTGSGQLKAGCIITYRYAAYDTIAGSFTTGANPLVLSAITPSTSQSRLIACGARASANVTLGTPTSMTALVTDSDASSPSYIVCDQTVAKGSTGTRSISTGSTSAVAGIMLAIKPTRNP